MADPEPGPVPAAAAATAEGEAGEEEEPRPRNKFQQFLKNTHDKIADFFDDKGKIINIVLLVLLHVCILAHFITATVFFIKQKKHDFAWREGYGLLLIMTICIYLLAFRIHIYGPYISEKADEKCWNPCLAGVAKVFSYWQVEWTIYIVLFVAIHIFIIIDCWHALNRLIALSGFYVILLFGFVFSKHPGDVKVRPVFTGLVMQFVFGLIVIKWPLGRETLNALAAKVSMFLMYTDVGSEFAFGSFLVKHEMVFAFKAMTVIFFLSFVVSILYHYGVLQQVVFSVGSTLQYIVGCTVIESMNAAANLFMGPVESPLILAPYLPDLTMSELHAVLAAGFASVAGTVLGAYISFGASPAHLITASIMSAPAALCYAKLFYPETEKSKTSSESISMPSTSFENVLDAACSGANTAVGIVLAIIANIIAFISFVFFINELIGFYGQLVHIKGATIENGLKYIFGPLSFLMGVPWNETMVVGELIATKTIVNEFVAYYNMGNYKRGISPHNTSVPKLTGRAEAVATYALCGFSNPGSVGIVISGFGMLAPTRRTDVVVLVWRSFISGIAACFLTACVAGLLVKDDQKYE